MVLFLKILIIIVFENVYYSDKCEEFNYLVTPCQSINDNEIQKCWELYDKVIKQLINRGSNNQFCDIEMFVIRDRNYFIKVMEINIAGPQQSFELIFNVV